MQPRWLFLWCLWFTVAQSQGSKSPALRDLPLFRIPLISGIPRSGTVQRDSSQLVFRAFGDVNLGRSVGQELLKGNIDYPFEHVQEALQSADVVFVNLESQLTDQGGETQHPKDIFVFCGPPQGATSLKKANISVVSTANNHAYDYGMKGLRETIEFLQKGGIRVAGSSIEARTNFPPVVVNKNSIRLGILAYTEFVNVKGPWNGMISLFERKRAKSEIDSARRVVDMVIVSYHGGVEYKDEPSKFTQAQMQFLADAGADIVLGHHSHVPQGIEARNGKLIFYSLGNFVFHQPQRFWTQTGLGVEFVFQKSNDGVQIHNVRLIPIRAGKQPTLILSDAERLLLLERLQRFSNVTLTQKESSFIVQIPSRN